MVTKTVEIEAEIATGEPDNVVRSVKAERRRLKSENKEFEDR